MIIGVFDSGVGGEKVAEAIKESMPQDVVLLRTDKKNLPYGNKTPGQLLKLIEPVMAELKQEGVDAVVIACNTVSTVILPQVKELINVPVVGFVPMLKPASMLTKTNVITVCATPATLKSKRYAELKYEFAENIKVIEPDCSDWAGLIEDSQLNEDKIREVISLSQAENSDVIVLGCTHYHWIEKALDKMSGPSIEVIQPTEPVIAELKRLLAA